tara:strand:+ start:151 stop:1311 length:1161 start_codon:yes stop_codon:yes gene_type:complete
MSIYNIIKEKMSEDKIKYIKQKINIKKTELQELEIELKYEEDMINLEQLNNKCKEIINIQKKIGSELDYKIKSQKENNFKIIKIPELNYDINELIYNNLNERKIKSFKKVAEKTFMYLIFNDYREHLMECFCRLGSQFYENFSSGNVDIGFNNWIREDFEETMRLILLQNPNSSELLYNYFNKSLKQNKYNYETFYNIYSNLGYDSTYRNIISAFKDFLGEKTIQQLIDNIWENPQWNSYCRMFWCDFKKLMKEKHTEYWKVIAHYQKYGFGSKESTYRIELNGKMTAIFNKNGKPISWDRTFGSLFNFTGEFRSLTHSHFLGIIDDVIKKRRFRDFNWEKGYEDNYNNVIFNMLHEYGWEWICKTFNYTKTMHNKPAFVCEISSR